MGRAFEVRKASMLKTGMAKTKIYTRHSKEIYLAAKAGGTNVDANLTLKRLIDKAKKEQVPADVIKRALDKVDSGQGEDFKANRYEGFGPNGATIIVDCLTDNANRTISDVKNCFTKSNNKIGVAGAVAHMYDNLGVITVKSLTEDQILEILLENDLDAKDIEIEEEDMITIYVEVPEFMKTRNVIAGVSGEDNIVTDEITWLPQITTELSGEDMNGFNKLLDMLNELDDVQNIYHNVEVV
jgi:YebC/PmpR family DNA-binding regulatory protein